MMLYKNVEAIVYSPDSDTHFMDIVTGDFQGNTSYMFITYRDYALRTSIDLRKEYGFMQKRQKADDTLQKLFELQFLIKYSFIQVQRWQD